VFSLAKSGLQQLGVLQLAPQPTVNQFSGWWRKSIAAAPKEARKGLNFLIILVAWELWKLETPQCLCI
jgi:hypothetical protein